MQNVDDVRMYIPSVPTATEIQLYFNRSSNWSVVLDHIRVPTSEDRYIVTVTCMSYILSEGDIFIVSPEHLATI